MIGSARSLVKFTARTNVPYSDLRGRLDRAMAPICVHRATRIPPDIASRHIGSRDEWQEDLRPARHSRQRPVPHFPAIHLARQSPFYGLPGHIVSRDVCRKLADLLHTALRARPGLFVKFTWNPDRHSTQVQGILLVQVTSNCAHLHLFR